MFFINWDRIELGGDWIGTRLYFMSLLISFLIIFCRKFLNWSILFDLNTVIRPFKKLTMMNEICQGMKQEFGIGCPLSNEECNWNLELGVGSWELLIVSNHLSNGEFDYRWWSNSLGTCSCALGTNPQVWDILLNDGFIGLVNVIKRLNIVIGISSGGWCVYVRVVKRFLSIKWKRSQF